MSDEELVFVTGFWVTEGAALWLEDGTDAFVGHEDVEPCEEVVVCEGNDALRSGK